MVESDRDRAIRLARELYEAKKREGMDFDSGPCLSEEVMPDWCVDIAHEPADNLPQNQCRSYRTGRVHHFVELDPEGNLIRAK